MAPSNSRVKVGIPQRGYGIIKNIPRTILADSCRTIDRHRILAHIQFILTKDSNRRNLFSFSTPYFPKVDILHFFNSINFSSTNWVVTFESLLPYWSGDDAEITNALNQLTKENCLGLIAMSKHAISNFEWRMNSVRYPEKHQEIIKNKTVVLYPPEPLRERKQSSSNTLQFTFVAREFYKKGGLIILRAFNRLKQTGIHNWSITMIGDLNSEGDSSQPDKESLYSEAITLLNELGNQVEHFSQREHASVIAQIQESHYLIHPTLQDTFGYVITEAMSAGCVPISCKIRAIPEFVHHNDNGYLINVRTDENANPRKYISAQMWAGVESQLHEILMQVFQTHQNNWERQSQKCQKIISTLCNPRNHEEAIRLIYERHQHNKKTAPKEPRD